MPQLVDFPELKHKLQDHVEDYEKMQGSDTFTHQANPATVNYGQSATKSTAEVDSFSLMTEQLNQMDTKQAEQDLKLIQLDTKLTVSATCAISRTGGPRGANAHLILHQYVGFACFGAVATRGHGANDGRKELSASAQLRDNCQLGQCGSYLSECNSASTSLRATAAPFA